MPEPLFDKSTILDALARLAERLGDTGGDRHTIILVGGSFMAVRDLRESTTDVDSMSALDDELRFAIASVAETRGWDVDWLNDHAKGYRPATFELDQCEIVYQHERLSVVVPPDDIVFLMKLQASRPQDRADLIRLWPRCTFSSPEDAAEQHRAAYPWEEPDPYLAGHVARLAAAAAAVPPTADGEAS